METEEVLTKKIIKITQQMNENYPELTKYMIEMPLNTPSELNPEISTKNLKEYYDSLVEILEKHKANHIVQVK